MRKHPVFKNINFKRLEVHMVEPPFCPDVSSAGPSSGAPRKGGPHPGSSRAPGVASGCGFCSGPLGSGSSSLPAPHSPRPVLTGLLGSALASGLGPGVRCEPSELSLATAVLRPPPQCPLPLSVLASMCLRGPGCTLRAWSGHLIVCGGHWPKLGHVSVPGGSTGIDGLDTSLWPDVRRSCRV